MRHSTNGLNEDDLSRLTGSSRSSTTSSASTTPSHDNISHTGKQLSSNGNVEKHENDIISDGLSIKSTIDCCTPARLSLRDNEFVNNLKNSSLHHHHQHQHQHQHHRLSKECTQQSHFNSSYLPEFIDPLEWQNPRKRKERLDSTSSTTQDRKLIRSNSEELLPNNSCSGGNNLKKIALKDCTNANHHNAKGNNISSSSKNGNNSPVKSDIIIRRVSSEDFKRTTTYHDDDGGEIISKEQKYGENNDDDRHQLMLNDDLHITTTNTNNEIIISNENDSLVANRQHQESSSPPYSPGGIEMGRRSRIETSPARSHCVSPNRSGVAASVGSKYQRTESDDSECEHERRRSSERFCKSRVPPGRKSGVIKKSSSSSKYLPTKMRGDENVYKYDLSSLKYERRGFVSKLIAADERNDYNDNNLIDFHIIRKSESHRKGITSLASISPPPPSQLPLSSSSSSSSSFSPSQQQQEEQQKPQPSPALSSIIDTIVTAESLPKQQQLPPSPIMAMTTTNNTTTTTTKAEPLPWDRSIPEDQTPILSRCYASGRHVDCIDTAAKLSKVMPYPQPFPKTHQQAILAVDDVLEPIEKFRAFTSLDNVKTRDVMQQIIPAMMSFQTPEERLKQVNKRLVALKKKGVQLEEAFEAKHGYRPSQVEKLNDRHLKNILIEINKLRKEKHELKTDPCGAISFKVTGGMDSAKKLEKMKATLVEMEQNLSDKREDGKRSETLEELTADQLIQEKSAVQHGLLYFESLFGRPATKDERHVARPLYNRYRTIKRMVSRSVTMSGSNIIGTSELPTIHEHEAMVFESMPQHYLNSGDDNTNSSSPSESTIISCDTSSSDGNATTTTDDSISTTTSEQINDLASVGDGVQRNAIGKIVPSSQLGENLHTLSIDKLWEHLDKAREEKRHLRRTIREYENIFEERNGRKMLKIDRKSIQDTYNQYKEKKAQTRFLQALIRKHISR